jgi:hypothetical protein
VLIALVRVHFAPQVLWKGPWASLVTQFTVGKQEGVSILVHRILGKDADWS